MRIWAEVVDAAGDILGLVNLVSVSVARRLDAAGDIQLSVPTSDPQAVKYMQVGRYVHVYVKKSDLHTSELIEKGVLMHDTISIGSSGSQVTQWQATDGLEDFRRENTLRGRVFNNRGIVSVVNDLLPEGWNAAFKGVSGNTSQRFDGLSYLKAIDRIRDHHGYHFRLGAGANRLEFGSFGEYQGIRVTNAAVSDQRLLANRNLVLIEKLTVAEDGYDVVNWIEPTSGPADGPLTLKRSTRTSPYPIQTMVGPDGKTIYYLADNDSISQYGTIKAVLNPKALILPVQASTSALINAADVLYDWGAATLARRSQLQKTYQINGIKVDKSIRPGDKIWLVYRGEVVQRGQVVQYVDIDEQLWVLEVSESYGVNGHTVSWQVSTVDIVPMSAANMVADVIQNQQQAATAVSIQVDRSNQSDTVAVSSTTPGSMTFTVQNSTIYVPSCLVTVMRESEDAPSRMEMTLDGEAIGGGPWLYAPDQLVFSIDLEETLNDGDIQGEHTLEFSVTYDGDGSDYEVVVSLVEATLGAASVGS